MEALRHHPVPHTSPLQAADAAVPVDVPNVDFIKGSAQEMDFESVFDLAFSNSALQWVKKLEEKANLFRWDYYRDKEGHMEHRTAALARFATDYASNYMGGSAIGRYVYAELPRLPFADGSFTLVLSSHFLFLYGDRLSPGFHAESLKELARV